MEESLALLNGFVELGYTKLITTPHIMSDTYTNTPETILSGLELLREAASQNGIEIEIEAAAEHYMDEYFLDYLKREKVMSIAGKYLLFETSYMAKPMQMEEMIFEIGAAGYIPLLAHPERYRYVRDMAEEYGRWKELGVLFQVNLNSFGGYYGKDAKAKAEFLSAEGMVDFLGSDVHHKKQVENLKKVFAMASYGKIYEHNTILNDTL